MFCVFYAQYSKVIYTVFKTERGNVFIIQDKYHKSIVSEICKRRKAQLLDWYGDVNPENELEEEIKKFKWLAEQEVLTEEQSERKIAEAELLYNQASDMPSRQLN